MVLRVPIVQPKLHLPANQTTLHIDSAAPKGGGGTGLKPFRTLQAAIDSQSRKPLIHPTFKQVFAMALLADNVQDAVALNVSKRGLAWVQEGVGRAFHVTNTGKDVEVTFTVNGNRVKEPF